MKWEAGFWGAMVFFTAATPCFGADAVAPSPSPAPDAISLLKMIRDPFKIVELDKFENRERNDLQSATMDDIRVVGILTGPTRTRAIVKVNTSSKTYVVGVGMRLGVDDELIQKITPNGITVVGSRVNVVGDREVLTTELPLVLENKQMTIKNQVNVSAPNAAGSPNGNPTPAASPSPTANQEKRP